MVRPAITQENKSSFGGLQIRYTDDIKEVGTNWTLFGPAGAGKSTFPLPLAESEEFGPLFYVASGSGLSVVQHKHIPYIIPEKWQDLQRVLDECKKCTPESMPPFKAIALDNLSEFIVLARWHVCPINGYPEGTNALRDWNKITQMVITYVREWRDLTEQLPIHVFFMAWDSDERGTASGAGKLTIDLNPALQKAYPGIVDTIGHISVPNHDPDHRVVNFTPDMKAITKFRRNPSANARKIPYEVYYGLDNLPIVDILKVMRHDDVWPADKYKRPNRGE